MRYRRVDRLGVRVLDGDQLTLTNRTNHTTITLPPEAVERWRNYLTRTFRRGGNRKPAKSNTRITGLFRTKRKGLYIGGAKDEQLKILIEKIKAAKEEGKGLTFFLWKNADEDGPPFTLNVDVDNSDSRSSKREIEDEDDDLFPEEEQKHASNAKSSKSLFDDEDD